MFCQEFLMIFSQQHVETSDQTDAKTLQSPDPPVCLCVHGMAGYMAIGHAVYSPIGKDWHAWSGPGSGGWAWNMLGWWPTVKGIPTSRGSVLISWLCPGSSISMFFLLFDLIMLVFTSRVSSSPTFISQQNVLYPMISYTIPTKMLGVTSIFFIASAMDPENPQALQYQSLQSEATSLNSLLSVRAQGSCRQTDCWWLLIWFHSI